MKMVKCPQCNGKGEYDVEDKRGNYPVKCTYCDGSGKIEKAATYSGIRKG